ncbi:MAG: hypothetical protein WDA42_00900 [Candidatus Bathyarchaeia archaeon]
MGLDMYLDAEYYFSEYIFGADGPTPAEKVQKALQAAGIDVPKPVKYIKVSAAYWRKANAIHQWFVDNVQEGLDNCGSYYVSREQLQTLLKTVKKAIAAYRKSPEKAGEILTPQDGFFFGSTDLDEWYLKGLEYTRDALKEALQLPEGWDFYYRSSW